MPDQLNLRFVYDCFSDATEVWGYLGVRVVQR